MIDNIEWINGHWSAIKHIAFINEYSLGNTIISWSPVLAAIGTLFAAKSAKTSMETSSLSREELSLRLTVMRVENTTRLLEEKSRLVGSYNDMFIRCANKRLDLIFYINKIEINDPFKGLDYCHLSSRRSEAIRSLQVNADEYRDLADK